MSKYLPSLLAKAACIAGAVVMLSACTTHRVEVQQGNILESSAIDELRVGMTRQQVRFLLGNPVIVDAFHANRWDYIYYTTPAGTDTTPQRLTLIFDGDVLREIVDRYRAEDESV